MDNILKPYFQHTDMKTKVQEQLGYNIRKARLKSGVSQEELAAKVGIHRTYIGSVERGERNIGIMNIVKIAAALNIAVSELVEGLSEVVG